MSTIPLNGPANKHAKGLASVVTQNEEALLTDWLREMNASVRRSDLMKEADLRAQCLSFLRLLREGLESGNLNFESAAWNKLREMLEDTSRSRAVQGFTPSETVGFVFSVKRPLFAQIRGTTKSDAGALGDQ